MAAKSIFSLSHEVQQRFQEAQQLYGKRAYAESAAILDEELAANADCLEFWALKGLVVRNIAERHKEALPAIRHALKLNIASEVAWQALGGYYTMESNPEQALKSYTQALSLAKDPSSISKELGRVQLTLRRDYAFLKTCQEAFIRDRNSRLDWMTIPVAIDLCDHPAEAAVVLGSWFNLPLEMRSRCTPQWSSQVRMYIAELLERAGKFDSAIQHMTSAVEIDSDFRCVTEGLTIIARCALKTGKYPQAEKRFRALLQWLPGNTDYMMGLLLSRPAFHCLLPSPFVVEAKPSSVNGSKKAVDTSTSDVSRTHIPIELYPDMLTQCGVRSLLHVSKPLVAVTNNPQHAKLRDPHTGAWKTAYNHSDLWRLCWQGAVSSVVADVDANVVLQAQELLKLFQELIKQYGKNEGFMLFPLAFVPEHPEIDPLVRETLIAWAESKLTKGSISIVVQSQILANTSRYGGPKWFVDLLDEALSRVVDKAAGTGADPSACIPKAICFACKSVIYRRLLDDATTAETLLDEAITLLPTMIDFYSMRAEFRFEDGQDEEALKLMTFCASLNTADKQLCSDAAVALCTSGDLSGGLEVLLNFNKRVPKPDSAPDQESTKFDSQDFEMEMAICRGLMTHGRVFEAEIADRLHWIITRLMINQEELQDFFVYALRLGNMSSLVDYIRYLRRIFSLKSGQKALKLLAKILFHRIDNPQEEEKAEIPEDLAKLIENVPCEIPIKHKFDLNAHPREKLLTEILPKLLTLFRADTSVQSFGVLRGSYQLHTRNGARENWVLGFCINQSYLLAGRNRLHSKFVRIFLHHVMVDSELREAVNILLPEELQTVDRVAYLKECMDTLGQSSDARDRYNMLRALEDCLAAARREQGTCCEIVTEALVAEMRAELCSTECSARAASRGAWEAVMRRMRRSAFFD